MSNRQEFAIRQIKPNPHRRFDINPLRPDSIAELVESIKDVGFWENVAVRVTEGVPELVYGHHRYAAALQVYGPDKVFSWQVVDYTDAQMLTAMARENGNRSEGKNDVLAIWEAIVAARSFSDKSRKDNQAYIAGLVGMSHTRMKDRVGYDEPTFPFRQVWSAKSFLKSGRITDRWLSGKTPNQLAGEVKRLKAEDAKAEDARHAEVIAEFEAKKERAAEALKKRQNADEAKALEERLRKEKAEVTKAAQAEQETLVAEIKSTFAAANDERYRREQMSRKSKVVAMALEFAANALIAAAEKGEDDDAEEITLRIDAAKLIHDSVIRCGANQ